MRDSQSAGALDLSPATSIAAASQSIAPNIASFRRSVRGYVLRKRIGRHVVSTVARAADIAYVDMVECSQNRRFFRRRQIHQRSKISKLIAERNIRTSPAKRDSNEHERYNGSKLATTPAIYTGGLRSASRPRNCAQPYILLDYHLPHHRVLAYSTVPRVHHLFMAREPTCMLSRGATLPYLAQINHLQLVAIGLVL